MNVSMKWPSYLKRAIEARSCRRCGAHKGCSCIDPRSTTVFVTVTFNDGPREFCYERVYDYFESNRPKNEGTFLLITYGGGVDLHKDAAILSALEDFNTGWSYSVVTNERDATVVVPEMELPRVLGELRVIVGATVKMKVGRDWVIVPEDKAS